MKTPPFPILCLCGLALPAIAAEPWFPGPKEIDLSFESLGSGDIDVRNFTALASGTRDEWTTEASLGVTTYRENYEPVLFGENRTLAEETILADVSLTRRWGREWAGTIGLGAYEGFAEYRSVWIAEYHRQLFGSFPSYQAPDPGGLSVRASSSWADPSGSRALSLEWFYAHDRIAPGWSFDGASGKPRADNDSLDTLGVSLSGEQAINGWLNTRLHLDARDTTGRDLRLGIENAWAATRGDFSLRLAAGYSREDPSFDSSHASAILEWRFMPQWSAHIGYRAYRDTGEIQSSGFNALAPPLHSDEIFGGILWNTGSTAASIGIGFLTADHDPLSEDNEFFGKLYQDRDWLTLRLGFSRRF
jgi:hypothetical protein